VSDGRVELGALLYAMYGLDGLRGPVFDHLIDEVAQVNAARAKEVKKGYNPINWVRSFFADRRDFSHMPAAWKAERHEEERRTFRMVYGKRHEIDPGGNAIFQVRFNPDIPAADQDLICEAIGRLPDALALLHRLVDDQDPALSDSSHRRDAARILDFLADRLADAQREREREERALRDELFDTRLLRVDL
jgi:hypothetical protein